MYIMIDNFINLFSYLEADVACNDRDYVIMMCVIVHQNILTKIRCYYKVEVALSMNICVAIKQVSLKLYMNENI